MPFLILRVKAFSKYKCYIFYKTCDFNNFLVLINKQTNSETEYKSNLLHKTLHSECVYFLVAVEDGIIKPDNQFCDQKAYMNFTSDKGNV